MSQLHGTNLRFIVIATINRNIPTPIRPSAPPLAELLTHSVDDLGSLREGLNHLDAFFPAADRVFTLL